MSQSHKSLRDVKLPLGASVTGDLRPRKPRPSYAIGSALREAASRWASAYLPSQHTEELRRALATLEKHPDHAGRGYSPAKDAFNRVKMELATRARQDGC